MGSILPETTLAAHSGGGLMNDKRDYEDFLQEGDQEKGLRDKVLKRGVVHEIHMAEDSVGNYYTKTEIDALLAAEQGHAHTDLASFVIAAVLGTQ